VHFRDMRHETWYVALQDIDRERGLCNVIMFVGLLLG